VADTSAKNEIDVDTQKREKKSTMMIVRQKLFYTTTCSSASSTNRSSNKTHQMYNKTKQEPLISILSLFLIFIFVLSIDESRMRVVVHGYVVVTTKHCFFGQLRQRHQQQHNILHLRSNNRNDYVYNQSDDMYDNDNKLKREWIRRKESNNLMPTTITRTIRDVQEEQAKLASIQALLLPESDLITIQLSGKVSLPSFWRRQNETVQCAILTPQYTNVVDATTSQIEALLLPLNDDQNQWKLLSYTYDAHRSQKQELQNQSSTKQMSRIVLLGLNAALINRDGTLFDNLPYATWTIDPDRVNRDFANNPIASKFHMGKRRAYNRLLTGFDTYGYRKYNINNKQNVVQSRELIKSSPKLNEILGKLQNTVTDIINPAKKEKQNDNSKSTSSEGKLPPSQQTENVQGAEINRIGNVGFDHDDAMAMLDDKENDETIESLTKRILEVRRKETEMDIAEWDYQLAVARADQNELDELYYENYKRHSQEMLDEIMEELYKLNDKRGEQLKSAKFNSKSQGPNQRENKQQNFAPSNGNTFIESSLTRASNNDDEEDDSSSQLPDQHRDSQYDSPYAMMREIIREQMNAEVIGAALEQTSLLDDERTSVLGGLIVLRRLAPRKLIRIVGERVSINDNDETYGNDGITGGETILVECQPDEAIGMHLACSSTSSLGLFIEKDLWERCTCMVRRTAVSSSNTTKINDNEWETVDPELSILMEGQARNQSQTDRVAPVRIPRSSLSMFDMMIDATLSATKRKNKRMFPTDNPIKSLNEYDALSNDGKARTLMTLSNFDGNLPRPRFLRTQSLGTTNSKSKRNALDELLLPLIDEAVRNQYLIREAMESGDMNRVLELEQAKSKKQIALEKAEQARGLGYDDEADLWESEAALYDSLRADSTQDVGSYSRFLDSDEWYERQRQETAKRVDKSKFGSLLDGVE
jgi:hypothetical protein